MLTALAGGRLIAVNGRPLESWVRGRRQGRRRPGCPPRLACWRSLLLVVVVVVAVQGAKLLRVDMSWRRHARRAAQSAAAAWRSRGALLLDGAGYLAAPGGMPRFICLSVLLSPADRGRRRRGRGGWGGGRWGGGGGGGGGGRGGGPGQSGARQPLPTFPSLPLDATKVKRRRRCNKRKI